MLGHLGEARLRLLIDNWSSLRVFNDEVIQPGQGFGFHPHRDIEGVLRVNGMSLAAGDQARIAGERTLRLEAAEDAEVILLDLP